MSTENELFDVVEVFGKTGLYCDCRVSPDDVPEGLFKYECRSSDDGNVDFCTLEKSVYVNFSGTILICEPIDLGAGNYLSFTEESSPNFLGWKLSVPDFMDYIKLRDTPQFQDAKTLLDGLVKYDALHSSLPGTVDVYKIVSDDLFFCSITVDEAALDIVTGSHFQLLSETLAEFAGFKISHNPDMSEPDKIKEFASVQMFCQQMGAANLVGFTNENGVNIVNPFVDETGRFEVNPEEVYGEKRAGEFYKAVKQKFSEIDREFNFIIQENELTAAINEAETMTKEQENEPDHPQPPMEKPDFEL